MNGMFGRVFGRGGGEDKEKVKKSAEDKTGQAMKTLNEKYEFCNMKLTELQRQADLRTTEIQECLKKGQKDRAKLILKRRKLLEGQIKATQNNQDRLMEQLMQLDMSQNNILTVQALAQAAEAGKANLKANDLENVEEVLDDIADQNTQMAQMQDALAMPTGAMADMDADELDEELAEMEAMQQDEELNVSVPHTKVQQPAQAAPAAAQPQRIAVGVDGSAAGGSELPSVPTHKAQMTDEDKDLEEIMKMAGQA